MGMRELGEKGRERKGIRGRGGRQFMPHACLPPKIPLLT